MAESYLIRLSRVRHLRKSWLYLSDSTKGHRRDTSGVDGRSVNQFALRADEYLQNLKRQLRQYGGYNFNDLKAHLEDKDSGGHRVICIPTVADRVVQRALLDILYEQPRYRFESEISYGFLKDRTVQDAVLRAAELRTGHPWVYKTDISKFFDTIDRKRMASLIRKKIPAPTIHSLLVNATKCEIQARDPSFNRKVRKAGISRGQGLRQGMPLSPYLSNLFLAEFDKSVVKSGTHAVRYADDLIFLADSRDQCRDLHQHCAKELSKIGLSIDPIDQGKTVVFKPNKAAEFLGVSIVRGDSGYVPIVSSVKKNQMKLELQKLSDINYLISNGILISKLTSILNNKIAGWNASYEFCANSQPIADFLETQRKQVIRRVFGEGMGINLNKRNRIFLEIDK